MAVEQASVEAPRVRMTAGRWLSRVEASESARISAARRAVRTGLVTIAAFSIGRWAVGSATVAVFATFTGLAITGIADFGGSIRGRAAAVTTTVLLGIGLTALGTWISAHGPGVGCAVMFAVVATIALTVLLGGYAAAWCATTLCRFGQALAANGAPDDSRFEPAPGAVRSEPFGLVARLAAVTETVNSHARAALGRSSDGVLVDAFATGPSRASWEDILHGARRFRANLTLRSVHVHDALRLGAGLALASAAVDAFGLQHGFWVAFATLTVIKSNLRATGRSVGEAISGTLIGFLIAFGLIAGLEPSIGWYVVLLPVVVTAAIYANVVVSFLAGQAGFTLVIVVLFNLLGPAGWQIGIVRVVDVAAGTLAGFVIGALAWPRGAASTIGNATADLVEAAVSYLAATARGFVGRPTPALDAAARQLAVDAALRAESSFAQYLTEHPPPEDLTGWAHWLSAGNRLWYAADLISATPHRSTEDAAKTAVAAERLLTAHSALGVRLRGRRAPPGATALHASAAGSDLPAWLDDLAADAAAQPGDYEEVPGDV